MKTTFIFGAGASKQAGAPLMNDFFDCASDLLRKRTPGIEEARQDFENVFDAISELSGVHSKAYLDLDNLEVVFGAIEMARLLGKLGNRTKPEIEKLSESLIVLIYKTLEQSILFPVNEQSYKVQPVAPFPGFIDLLKRIKEEAPRQDPHHFSFITFNYDLCLDQALYWGGINYDYCLAGRRENISPLLKLHGSINWGKSITDEIVPWNISAVRTDLFDLERYNYELGSKLSSYIHAGQPLSGPPVIVPPTWNKTAYHSQLSTVWSVAASELASSNNIVVIGYSLPETDSFFRYLYALGTNSHTRLRNFIVINPDQTGTVESRFRAMLGRGIESRIDFLDEPFYAGVGSLHRLVGS